MARVLLLYITANSGHYRASLAIQRAVTALEPKADVLVVDAFGHFNPILSRIVDRAYMLVIRKTPQIWDRLYDNPDVTRKTQAFRRFLHRYDARKLRPLLARFQPTVIACTQAFPCGVVADYKQATGLNIPLYAILTDFIPHAYWLHDHVDGYFVGSEIARDWLVKSGILPAKIRYTGIPIDPVFAQPSNGVLRHQALGLDQGVPMVLLMGGGQGLGPIEQVAIALDALPQAFQLVVITGVNGRLQQRLTALAPGFRRKIVVLGHVPFVHELMSLATLVVTKPGGLTTAEALAKQLPMLIVDPIPGQEVKNTQFLLGCQAAVRAQRWDEVPQLVSDLMQHPERVAALRQAAAALGRPRSALEIAQVLLGSR